MMHVACLLLLPSPPQAISLLVYMSGKEGCHGPYLILCPLSVVQNWKSELARYGIQESLEVHLSV